MIANGSATSARDRAAVARARLEVKVRGAIFETIHHTYGGQMSTADGALIAREFFECTSHEFRKRIVDLWSPRAAMPSDTKADKKGLRTDDDWKRQQAFEKRIATLDAVDLARLLLDLALVSDVAASVYNTAKPTKLLATAERLGVDAAQIRRELSATTKPAAKPKTKTKPASRAGKKVPAAAEATA